MADTPQKPSASADDVALAVGVGGAIAVAAVVFAPVAVPVFILAKLFCWGSLAVAGSGAYGVARATDLISDKDIK